MQQKITKLATLENINGWLNDRTPCRSLSCSRAPWKQIQTLIPAWVSAAAWTVGDISDLSTAAQNSQTRSCARLMNGWRQDAVQRNIWWAPAASWWRMNLNTSSSRRTLQVITSVVCVSNRLRMTEHLKSPFTVQHHCHSQYYPQNHQKRFLKLL